MLPVTLRERLGSAAPVVIHGVGDKSILHSDGVGIVSPAMSHPGELRSRARFLNAVLAGFHVVSGAMARGGQRRDERSGRDAGWTSSRRLPIR